MTANPAPHLKQALFQEARRLGFDLIGVTTPDSPPHYAVYEAWLRAGRHGQMQYLERETARQRRAEPRLILPECRSILVLGMRYSPQKKDNPPPAGQTVGRVAAYAWGDDYHEIMLPLMEQLVSFIQERVPDRELKWRAYTDTGPILERDLAQRAGLGWIGKNTCLINPQIGSYTLLGEILLSIHLEPDSPFTADRCGSCRRCLDACPTGCILTDRTIDSRRCISYLTIELKGTIPRDLRPGLGNWIFGCDICQQVCPWNQRFAERARHPAYTPREGVPAPQLIDELRLSPEGFRRKFRGSAVKRAKRAGYLRNVAIATGNSQNPAAVNGLIESLQNEQEALVRQHVAWALGRIGGETARNALEKALQTENDPQVLEEIRLALD